MLNGSSHPTFGEPLGCLLDSRQALLYANAFQQIALGIRKGCFGAGLPRHQSSSLLAVNGLLLCAPALDNVVVALCKHDRGFSHHY